MIAVVVPNLNGERWLGKCLDSLLAQSQDANIIVVDNASSDGSVAFVAENYPHVACIKLARNLGFAGGVNAGIRFALEQGAEFVALFNNDAVAEPDWLKKLFETAKKQSAAGIVTGKLMRLDKKHLDGVGDQYSTWGLPFPRGRDEVDAGQYDKGGPVFAGTGGASLYRTEMLREIGLFDEAFFAYYEDVDISFRAHLAGWEVVYEPAAVAYHEIGKTSSKMGTFARYHTIKNCYYLYLKNMPSGLFWKYLPKFGLGMFLIVANSLRRGQISPLLKAYGRLVVTSPAALSKRWQAQRLKKVPDEAIEQLFTKQLPPTQKLLTRWKRGARGV